MVVGVVAGPPLQPRSVDEATAGVGPDVADRHPCFRRQRADGEFLRYRRLVGHVGIIETWTRCEAVCWWPPPPSKQDRSCAVWSSFSTTTPTVRWGSS